MRKMLVIALIVGLAGCSQKLPEGTDNIPPGPNWERIATIPGGVWAEGIYKVVDTEDGTIMYYAISKGNIVGIPAMAYYHEGSKENYRQVE